MDRSSWRWRAGGSWGSWEPDVLIPGPVIRRGLPVGLLGKLIHLGHRNECIAKYIVWYSKHRVYRKV